MTFVRVRILDFRNLICLASVAFTVLAAMSSSAQLIHVPGDQPTIQQAIGAVPNGGVIEIADGTYTAPSGGFTIYGGTKGFTMRAASGANVVLSGGGSTDIVRFTDSSLPVHFQRLTFANGSSTTNYIGGAMTLVNVNASFTSCTFRNNFAGGPNGTGGGAIWMVGGASSFFDCTFADNTSRNFGGGLSIAGATAYVSNCSFTGNRTNLPNHSGSSSGGGIYAVNSTVHVQNSAFRNNQAGLAGGAIYMAGAWKDPETSVSSLLSVYDSEFTANLAVRDASVSFPAPAVGGAIHTELQTTLQVGRCRFNANIAPQGGAISLFKSTVTIDSSVFRGNATIGTAGQDGFGGTIMAMSPDMGAPHHRSISIIVRDTLFEGTSGSSTTRSGGCIFASGNRQAAYGIGQAQSGSVESDRATVSLTRVAIRNFSTAAAGGLPGTGGAIQGSFINLTMVDSIISDCTSTNSGGGLQLNEATVASINNSTIMGCKSGGLGAVTMFGGTLNATDTAFLQNENAGGRGAAITTAPQPAGSGMPDFDQKGLVQNCLFSGNVGDTTLYNGDRSVPPFNRLQYGNNQFSPLDLLPYVTDFGNKQAVATMNKWALQRSDGSVSTLSPVPNVALTSPAVKGAFLLLPPILAQSGGPGEAMPSPSYVAYAAAGGTPFVDRTPQRSSTGAVPITVDSAHTFTVGSESVSIKQRPGAPLNISTRLPVGTGDSGLIGGFIIQGNAPKRVLIRALGPSLAASGVQGSLEDPRLDLYDARGTNIASNDNWQSTQIAGAISNGQLLEIHATGVSPASGLEPALIATLQPNVAYTAVVRGVNDRTGVAVVEAYDLDGADGSKLVNISTRGRVGAGDNVMIGGFIYGGGGGATQVLVRAIGPSLTGSVAGPLEDPTLEIYDANGRALASNDDWEQSQSREIQASGLQPKNKSEAAIILSGLARGAYTAVVRGQNAGTGIGLVEVYVF